MKKTLLFFSLIMVLSLGLLIGCGETTEPEVIDDPENGAEEAAAEEEEVATGYETGETVKMGDLHFTINNARWDTGDQYFGPEEGEKWLVIDCTIQNNSDESVSVSSMLMFEMVDEENYSVNQSYSADTRGSLDGELGAGRAMSGEISFIVGEDQTQWEFIFQPEVFGFGQAIYDIHIDDVQEE